jgi:hypothetical protein
MKRPLSRGQVPVGGLCRYVDPEAGFTITHPYWDFCKAKAKDERLRRGLLIPYNWDAFFEEQFCKATPRACVDIPDAPIETSPNWLTLAAQFGTSLARWIMAGAPLVTWEGFKARYVQCTGDEEHARCPYLTKFASFGIPKCGGCGCSTVKLFLETERCPKGRW